MALPGIWGNKRAIHFTGTMDPEGRQGPGVFAFDLFISRKTWMGDLPQLFSGAVCRLGTLPLNMLTLVYLVYGLELARKRSLEFTELRKVVGGGGHKPAF